MKKNLFHLLSFIMTMCLFLSVERVNAQVTIGATDASHPGAVLDLRTEKGLLLPKAHLESVTKFRLSTGKTKEAAGMIIYNMNPDIEGGYGVGLYLWDGSKWNLLGENEMPVIDCTGSPANIKIEGFSKTVKPNEPFDVTCTVNTSGKTIYTWTIPQGLEVSGDRDKQTITLIAKTAGSYNGGSLSCAVVNACGGGSSIAAGSQLTVNDCSDTPTANMTAISGSSSTFTVTCTITNTAAAGTIEYVWTVPDGLQITGGQNTNKITVQSTKDGIYKGEDIICSVKNKCVAQAVQFKSSGTVTIITPGEGTVEGSKNEDGSVNVYERYCYTMQTGNTCWMTKNSREGKGTYTRTTWTNNGVTHNNVGYYYTYEEANNTNAKGQYTACPEGWTLPTKDDFNNLLKHLRNKNVNPTERDYWLRNSDKDGIYMLSTAAGWHEYSGFWGIKSDIVCNENNATILDEKFGANDVDPNSQSGHAAVFNLSVRCIKRMN